MMGSIDNPTPRGIAERMRSAMGRQVGTAIKLLDMGFQFDKVDGLTQDLRIGICEGCPRFDQELRQCLECECPMDYKTTLRLNPLKVAAGDPDNLIKCPLRKW